MLPPPQRRPLPKLEGARTPLGPPGVGGPLGPPKLGAPSSGRAVIQRNAGAGGRSIIAKALKASDSPEAASDGDESPQVISPALSSEPSREPPKYNKERAERQRAALGLTLSPPSKDSKDAKGSAGSLSPRSSVSDSRGGAGGKSSWGSSLQPESLAALRNHLGYGPGGVSRGDSPKPPSVFGQPMTSPITRNVMNQPSFPDAPFDDEVSPESMEDIPLSGRKTRLQSPSLKERRFAAQQEEKERHMREREREEDSFLEKTPQGQSEAGLNRQANDNENPESEYARYKELLKQRVIDPSVLKFKPGESLRRSVLKGWLMKQGHNWRKSWKKRFFRVVVHTVVERVLDERELEALGPAHDPKAALMRNKVMERAPLAEVVKDAWLVYYTDEDPDSEPKASISLDNTKCTPCTVAKLAGKYNECFEITHERRRPYYLRPLPDPTMPGGSDPLVLRGHWIRIVNAAIQCIGKPFSYKFRRK